MFEKCLAALSMTLFSLIGTAHSAEYGMVTTVARHFQELPGSAQAEIAAGAASSAQSGKDVTSAAIRSNNDARNVAILSAAVEQAPAPYVALLKQSEKVSRAAESDIDYIDKLASAKSPAEMAEIGKQKEENYYKNVIPVLEKPVEMTVGEQVAGSSAFLDGIFAFGDIVNDAGATAGDMFKRFMSSGGIIDMFSLNAFPSEGSISAHQPDLLRTIDEEARRAARAQLDRRQGPRAGSNDVRYADENLGPVGGRDEFVRGLAAAALAGAVNGLINGAFNGSGGGGGGVDPCVRAAQLNGSWAACQSWMNRRNLGSELGKTLGRR